MQKQTLQFPDEELTNLFERFRNLKDNLEKNISEVIAAAETLEDIRVKKLKSKSKRRRMPIEKV